jgi:hypothetical protein
MDSTHGMRFERLHASGAQEWFCPICGRRLLMQWPPAIETKVLVPGDQNACHTGGKVADTSRQLANDGEQPFGSERQQGDQIESDEVLARDALRPWLKWVREAGIDDLWNAAA